MIRRMHHFILSQLVAVQMMKIKGKPLTHVDWLIKIIDPSGNEIFKSSTIHSQIGIEGASFAPIEKG
jgi:hypothetical protein